MPTGEATPPILLVEESPSDRELLKRAFGGSATAVADAADALEAVRRTAFAAIVLAHALPRRSGLDLLRELRGAGDHTPVVLMLEQADAELAGAALRAGAAAYAVKHPGFDAEMPEVVARALAAPGATSADVDVRRDVLVCDLDGQRHGFFAADVHAVTGALHVSALPGAPPGIEGAILYHGRLVPVIDLRAQLALPPRPVDPGEHVVILRGDGLAAVRVDRAEGLVHVADDARVADGARGVALAGIAAVVRVDDAAVFVHDVAHVRAPVAGVGHATEHRT